MKTEIWVRLKGSPYSWNTHCSTLKEVIETYPLVGNRRNIAEWWKQDI